MVITTTGAITIIVRITTVRGIMAGMILGTIPGITDQAIGDGIITITTIIRTITTVIIIPVTIREEDALTIIHRVRTVEAVA